MYKADDLRRGGIAVSAREDMIRNKINEMREKVTEAYLEDDYDYNKVLRLSIKLDRLILLELKARRNKI